MNLAKDWSITRRHFNKSFSANFHIAIASLDAHNNPTVTPIGTLFLNDDQTGFYFEKFPSKLPQYAKRNPKICLLGVNSGRWFWIKSLFLGKFSDHPGMKLYGELGERRRATAKEISRLNRRMRITKGLKGHDYLWGKMEFVREIRFTSVEPINLGNMSYR